MSIIETLERCILFTGLPFEAITLIRTQSPVIFLKPGEILIRQGEVTERDLFILLEGELELRFQVESQSQEMRVETLSPGEVIGEIGIFWPHPRIGTVIATRSSRLLKITSDHLQRLRSETYGPIVMLNVVCLLSNRIELMNRKLASQTQIGLKLALPALPVTLLPETDHQVQPVTVSPPRPLLVGSLLENSPLGEFLGRVYQEMIGTLLEVRRYETTQLIFKEGSPSQEALLICSGSVQISRSLNQGEIVLATINSGELIGEMGLFRGVARSATARALSPVIALSLPEDFAQQLLESKPFLASRLLEYTAQLLEKRLILLNELCARMELLQRFPPTRGTVAPPSDPEVRYLDYRFLQYLFTQLHNAPVHRRTILRETLGLLQNFTRTYPELELLCRQRPVTITPVVLTEGMEANKEEILAAEILEEATFLHTLLLGQRWTSFSTLKDVLARGIEEEQMQIQKLLFDAQKLFARSNREQRFILRYKMIQNLTSLQLQAIQVFISIGFPNQNQEQRLRLSRELLQSIFDQIRLITN
jgi:CRP-like cAMP-binding protein